MNWVIDAVGFMPHAICLLQDPNLIMAHVISDGVIAFAYFSIPVILLYFLRKHSGIPYPHVLVLFAAFILLCGLTHIVGIWTIWKPVYYLEGVVKAMTALVSLITAISLVPLVPKILSLRSPKELEQANRALVEEINRRDAAENSLRQANARLTQSNHDLEQFAYVASHDLQAPLRTVAGFSKLLERQLGDEPNAEIRENIDYVRAGVQNMQRLIDDLLELSRVDSQPQMPSERDLGSTVNGALAQLHADIKSSGAHVHVDPLPTLVTEHHLLQQVIQNLVSNGLKFQVSGNTPEIRITVEQDPRHVALTISDNGIGMTAAQQQEIFKAFKRLHTDDEYAGTGLGLAIVQKIVLRLGGEVSVRSEPGQGTAMTLQLPIQPPRHQHGAQATRQAAQPAISGASATAY